MSGETASGGAANQAGRGCSKWWLLSGGLVVALLMGGVLMLLRGGPGEGVKISEVPASVRAARLNETADGRTLVYRLRMMNGQDQWVSPEAYARMLYEDHRRRPLTFQALNISTRLGIAWVGLGLLGQVLFTGRMVVQWLASERHKRSVVPVAFWWMSLIGATMLIIYFTWRKDIVGVLGQATGWFIYIRNLRLIHLQRRTGGNAAAAEAQTEA